MELIQEADRPKWMAHSNHSIKCFTKGDIERMTNNYRSCLGRGAFGEVYEGVLEDESMVAVKRFIHNVKENFAKELTVHREINHRNVVRLIGYCVEENAFVLVTEYIANGNLSYALHNDNRPIPLDVRLRIAIECAEALAYMHSHMYTQVIHGDIKPGNILLDSNFHAKLADFGISRLANTDKTLYTENVMGSIGYMDPLFSLDGRLTVKNDVYSFGVVLLELIARKKATTAVGSVNFVYAFSSALARGVRGVREMFDAEITSKDNMKLLEGIAKLAGECLITTERDKRPQMVDVAERLRVLQKDSHRDPGWRRADLFSWVRKSKPASPPSAIIPAKILPPDLHSKPSPPPSAMVPAMILRPDLCRQFSLAEMETATDNFSASLVIRGGRRRRIYRGSIDGATTVAVKLVHDIDDFHCLIGKMSNLRHVHLVPLIGYCHLEKERKTFLVYEYMARGNLRNHIVRTQKPLSWKQRLETCIGVAHGLRYLHELQVTHGDVTMANVLLDEEWLAKIKNIDFPRSKEFDTTGVVASPGYVDPQYCYTGKYTEKSDIYSFGVVLLEVLSGERYRHLDEHIRWALRCKEKGSQIVEPCLKGQLSPQCLQKFLQTAAKCLSLETRDRPSMEQVISDLEYALELQNTTHNATD